jgi:hypothetical protein
MYLESYVKERSDDFLREAAQRLLLRQAPPRPKLIRLVSWVQLRGLLSAFRLTLWRPAGASVQVECCPATA